jgi:hypothetical protein
VVARFINQTSAYFDRLRIDASFFKCANVQKHIWSARIGLNKSKAPVGIPPCQRTEGHYFFALSPKLDQAAQLKEVTQLFLALPRECRPLRSADEEGLIQSLRHGAGRSESVSGSGSAHTQDG